MLLKIMKNTFLILASLAALGLVSCTGQLGYGQMTPRVNVEEVERQEAVTPTPNPTGVQGYDDRFGGFHGYGRNYY
ncbi:hypothetical protein AAFN60_06945 [Roseibacillus persicicus]|uniref:Lipoprotein n=2 Tax=Roseibacillus persicicus TaxID=454148 RepID=A0A918TCI6_9BACT|nr:hypothetical protein GCM10007100_02420 [Roseibacillus persicicus]